MDDALVGAAAEVELGIAKGFDERAVDQCVYIWKDPAHSLVGEDFFVCKAGIAPYVLACLLLYASGELRKGLDLIERITPGKGDIRELVGLDNLEQFIDADFPAAGEVPRLRIVAARAMMGTARTLDRRAESGAVGHGFFQYIQYPYLHNFLSSSPGRMSSHDFMASNASREP